MADGNFWAAFPLAGTPVVTVVHAVVALQEVAVELEKETLFIFPDRREPCLCVVDISNLDGFSTSESVRHSGFRSLGVIGVAG
jgi:hypothetical protein